MPYLPSLVIEPKTSATAAVIWLHGLGADGHDFEPVVPALRLPASPAVRFILPHAPSLPVTINGGYVMPAWYDILEAQLERKVDENQLKASAREVHKLIDREIEKGIDSSNIIIAGFSQGGAVGYEAALTYPKPLGGVLGLSTYFATRENIQVHSANKDIPIQVFHGSMDPVVPEALGKQSYEAFTGMGYSAKYKTYPMQHNVIPEEIKDISTWIQSTLTP